MIFHDKGSGGFDDKKNVIDGFFNEVCGLNPSFGPFGDVQPLRAGRHGHSQRRLHHVCGQLGAGLERPPRGFEGTNPDNSTVFINGTDPLPAAAAQIAAAAGPRY